MTFDEAWGISVGNRSRQLQADCTSRMLAAVLAASAFLLTIQGHQHSTLVDKYLEQPLHRSTPQARISMPRVMHTKQRCPAFITISLVHRFVKVMGFKSIGKPEPLIATRVVRNPEAARHTAPCLPGAGFKQFFLKARRLPVGGLHERWAPRAQSAPGL